MNHIYQNFLQFPGCSFTYISCSYYEYENTIDYHHVHRLSALLIMCITAVKIQFSTPPITK
jgi:hypothetical protein